MTTLQEITLEKKQRLERGFAWIQNEFKHFSTLSDIDFYNLDKYIDIK